MPVLNFDKWYKNAYDNWKNISRLELAKRAWGAAIAYTAQITGAGCSQCKKFSSTTAHFHIDCFVCKRYHPDLFEAKKE